MVRKIKATLLSKIFDNWPLKRYLGFYSFLPVFFCLGAGIEYLMINLNINNVNFYKTYSKRLAEESAQKMVITPMNIEELIESEKQRLTEKLKERQNKEIKINQKSEL